MKFLKVWFYGFGNNQKYENGEPYGSSGGFHSKCSTKKESWILYLQQRKKAFLSIQLVEKAKTWSAFTLKLKMFIMYGGNTQLQTIIKNSQEKLVLMNMQSTVWLNGLLLIETDLYW